MSKQNSKLTVITFDGLEVPRSLCRKIKNDFYKIGDINKKDSGGCYNINGRFYRINSGLIVWDYEQEQYILSHGDLLYGYVDKKELGYFTKNKKKNVYIRKNCPIISNTGMHDPGIVCLNEEVAKKNSNFLSLIDGFYYNLEENFTKEQKLKSEEYHTLYSKRYNYGKIPYEGFDSGTYSISESVAVENLNKEYETSDISINKNVGELFKFFNGLSFGYEEETMGGRLPENMLYKYGIVPLRDGSIGGHEYTSIPYRDEKGLQSFVNAFKEGYNKFCYVDQNCSLHYHIGNIFENLSEREFKLQLIAIYMLYYYIQSELWEIIPPYKRSNDYFKDKKDFKDHCKPLKSLSLVYNKIYRDGGINNEELDKYFNILFRFVNDGIPMNTNNNLVTRRHYKYGQPKWHIDSRYYSINMFNALFSNSRTIEFRAMSPTTNINKALPWLLICVGIIRFAQKYTKEIIMHRTKFYLGDIVEEFRTNFGKGDINESFGNDVANMLHEFISLRREYCMEMYLKKQLYGDEFKADSEFSISGINVLKI